jgi:hypothetical protein
MPETAPERIRGCDIFGFVVLEPTLRNFTEPGLPRGTLAGQGSQNER